VSVAEFPRQIAGDEDVAVTVGEGMTVTVACEVEEHVPLVPVTVYVVVEDGLTVTEVPLSAPGFHVYVVAPDAVSVVDVPSQMVIADGETVTVGVGTTVTVTCAEEVQPFAAVPTIVYVVVAAGVTVTVVPLNAPGFHV
jgi:hypothetical protein